MKFIQKCIFHTSSDSKLHQSIDFKKLRLFLEDMSILNRLAFSLALLKNQLVSIDCYIDGCDYLESKYLGENDIISLKEKISSNVCESNIIDFNYKNKKKMIKLTDRR